MTMTHEMVQTEQPDHAGVAFHPPLLLAAALSAGFGARWVTPLRFLPDDLTVLAGPAVVVSRSRGRATHTDSSEGTANSAGPGLSHTNA